MKHSRSAPARTKRLALVATFVVVLVVAVSTAASSAITITRSGSSSVCADFPDTVGLYEGNTVTMLGIEVGTVESIESRGDHMRVVLDVDDDLKLPADVGAVTLSDSIVTDRHVEFTAPFTGGPTFDRSSCIPLKRTKTPIGVSETFEAVQKLSNELLGTTDADPHDPNIPEKQVLGDTLRALDTAFEGAGPPLNSAIAQISSLVGNPADKDTTVRRLIDSLDTLSTALENRWPDLQTLLDNLENGLGTVGGFSEAFGSAIDLTVEFLPVLERNLPKYAPKVYALLDQLVPVVKVVLGRVGDIKDILSQVPTVTNNLMSLYDSDLRSGRVTYRPPQFEVGTQSAVDICQLAREYTAACSQDPQRGDVVDVGLIQLVLGSAGWR